MKKLLFISLLAISACSDDSDNTNLTGNWIIVEPPQTPSRKNRLDGSVPAFDVIFEIKNNTVPFVDLLLYGNGVDEDIVLDFKGDHADITIESNGFYLKLTNCKRVGSVILADMEFDLPTKNKQTYKGINVHPFYY